MDPKKYIGRAKDVYKRQPENVSFRKMTMNGATKPVTVKLEEAVETELPAEGQERDSEFGLSLIHISSP